MSALRRAGHFVDWARPRPAVDERSFAPRALYGDYVEAVLAEAERGAAGALERIAGEVPR